MAMVIVLIIILILTLYKYSTKNYDFWKKKGVPYAKPLPLFGNFLPALTLQATLGHHLEKLYKKFESLPYFGAYLLSKPYLILRDPDLIKTILIRDFNYFPDRNISFDKKTDPILSQTLAFVGSEKWKPLRSKLTPIFSITRMKSMVPLIVEVATEMVFFLEENANKGSIEAKELCAKFSTDVISSCAFGMRPECFKNENAGFRLIGRKMFGFSWRNAIIQASYLLAPDMARLFGFSFFDRSCYDFMRKAFWVAFEERKNNQEKRNDLIDAINQMRDEGSVDDSFKLEGDLAVAQAAIFYAAGFEPVSSAMAFTLYELCLHQEIQDKIRQEVKVVLEEHGSLTYEAVQDLKYTEMVIYEGLRKYPALPFLERISKKDYVIPNTNIHLEKGTPIFVPMYGLYHDPKYFPNPDKFHPERFTEEKRDVALSLRQFAFGSGPRSCIGEMFGLMEIKIGLVQILSRYKVERSSDTPVPIEFDTRSFLLTSKVGLPMIFRNI